MKRYKYAIQFKESGELLDYCETKEQAEWLLAHYPVELIEISKSSKLSLLYTELGGPWGYGHQEPALITYGGLERCIINLYKFLQKEFEVYTDFREINDYFRRCSLIINGEDKTGWLIGQLDKLNKSQNIFVGELKV